MSQRCQWKQFSQHTGRGRTSRTAVYSCGACALHKCTWPRKGCGRGTENQPTALTYPVRSCKLLHSLKSVVLPGSTFALGVAALSEHIFDCHKGWKLLASSEERPGMLLETPSTQDSPCNKAPSRQNIQC